MGRGLRSVNSISAALVTADQRNPRKELDPKGRSDLQVAIHYNPTSIGATHGSIIWIIRIIWGKERISLRFRCAATDFQLFTIVQIRTQATDYNIHMQRQATIANRPRQSKFPLLFIDYHIHPAFHIL